MSWGQRIFDIITPSTWSQINIQHEINFHNLKSFPDYSAIPSSHRMFNGTTALFFLVIPIASLFNYPNRIFCKYGVPVYPFSGIYITLLILIVKIWEKYTNHGGYYSDEVVELSASVGFWLYSISELDKCLRKKEVTIQRNLHEKSTDSHSKNEIGQFPVD
ncbi:hypothetical protein [Methylobacter svalbardensis]|uniref:hypothetical protein n=1 Tax=Methylobacter svalbardensis TaxID=3080016 RepID=UPI0030EC1B7A